MIYMLSDLCANSNVIKVIMIIKTIITIICVAIPVALIVVAMVQLVRYVMSKGEEDGLTMFKKLASKFSIAVVVFLIPTIVNAVMGLIGVNEEYQNCMNNATQTNYESAYNSEQAAALAEKARILSNYEEQIRQNDEDDPVPSNPGGGGTGETGGGGDSGGTGGGSYYNPDTSSGEWGYLSYSNGTFTLKNTRATNDSQAQKGTGQKGLNIVFSNMLDKFFDAAPSGCNITISSGYRSVSSQWSIWNNSTRPCPGRCSWVAYPGGSRHNYGIAADLKFNGTSCSGGWDCNSCAKWAHANAGSYGLRFRLNNEAWHIEPTNLKGGSYSQSCRSLCK